MEIKSKFLCSRGVALAFAILLGGSPGVLLYANDSVEESLTVAQTGRTIKGLVTDVNGEPLIGCNVVVVGSNAGVITDIDGRFALNVPADAKQIKISYIGYVDQIITLHDRSDFKVVLKEDNNALDEVVVVGYGTQKKATLTGAVEQVSSKVLESRAITNVGAALQGATPGLVVTRSSSRPGNEGLNFQIRGATSVNGGKVLIIVDGVPTLNDASFQNLNPDDIESISVLKDGSASIYGAKAANGVILVTTKKGKGKVTYYKMFVGDTGLFVTLAFWDKDYTENTIYEKLLSDKLSSDMGYAYENLVAQMLTASGNKLFYYTFPHATSHKNYEIDFLLSRGKKIYPIEVKSSGYNSHKSLDEFCLKFSDRIDKRYLLYTKDFKKDGQTLLMPIYMTPLL